MNRCTRGMWFTVLGLATAWCMSDAPLWGAKPESKRTKADAPEYLGDAPNPEGKASARAEKKNGSEGEETSDAPGTAPKRAGKTARDPVVSAFAIPRGVTLNADQQEAYNRLKGEHESSLRAAMEKMAQASDKTEKTKAARDALELRSKIREGMQTILAMPYVAAQKEAMEAAQKHYMEMKKRGYGEYPKHGYGVPYGRKFHPMEGKPRNEGGEGKIRK